MTKNISCISPIDNSLVAERPVMADAEIKKCINASNLAQKSWSQKSIQDKAILCHKAIDALLENTDEISKEISQQMGRPVQYCAGELRGVDERARYMIDIAEQALEEINIEQSKLSTRLMKRVPLGVVFIIAPWNYPYLTAINSIIPALMAGNTVLLKHSAQTLLCAERFAEAFKQAGLPDDVFQYCHVDHDATKIILGHQNIHFISFTGSVKGGETIENSIAGSFKASALELGGNDPAYIRADLESGSALFENVIDNVMDGAFFNSGQSCCAVERIYVHENVYSNFVEGFIEQVKKYKIGNPLQGDTSIGPLINNRAAIKARNQISQAVTKGAKTCISDNFFHDIELPENYLAPQVLINVDHSMDIMTCESFAPIIGIMKVPNDAAAIELMNDSQYGLTASIWSNDNTIFDIADQIQTGTVFLNRCDYLDPALAWGGVKNSGRGCSLSVLAYQQLTRAKSYYFQPLNTN